MRWRIAVSMAIGVGSGVYCWFLLMHFHLGAGDFNWAVWAAEDLLAHRNPYARPMQLYPLTSRYARMAVVVGWPFLPLLPLRATADRPRPLARSSSSQVSRPRCAALAAGCADAAALVLRHLHSLADSQDAPGNYLDDFLQ